MSSVTTIKHEFRSQEAIVGALKLLGLEPFVYFEAQPLKGYGGRKPKAHIIVPRSQGFADLGFIRDGDIYHLIADEMDLAQGSYGRERPYGYTFLKDLNRQCSKLQVLAIARKLGYRTKVQPLDTGGFRIELKPNELKR